MRFPSSLPVLVAAAKSPYAALHDVPPAVFSTTEQPPTTEHRVPCNQVHRGMTIHRCWLAGATLVQVAVLLMLLPPGYAQRR